MRLSNKYGGLQFFAPVPNIGSLTVVFDSHIINVSGASAAWEVSGTNATTVTYDDESVNFTVTLESNYVIDSIIVSDGTVPFDITETTFKLTPSGGTFNDQTVTITSKLGGRVQ